MPQRGDIIKAEKFYDLIRLEPTDRLAALDPYRDVGKFQTCVSRISQRAERRASRCR